MGIRGSLWFPPGVIVGSYGATDPQKYKQRNEIERLFRRLKGCRRIFTRYDKLDVVFACFIMLELIAEALK